MLRKVELVVSVIVLTQRVQIIKRSELHKLRIASISAYCYGLVVCKHVLLLALSA